MPVKGPVIQEIEPKQRIKRNMIQRFILGRRSFKGKTTKNAAQKTIEAVMRNLKGRVTLAQSKKRQVGRVRRRMTPAKRCFIRFIPLVSPASNSFATSGSYPHFLLV